MSRGRVLVRPEWTTLPPGNISAAEWGVTKAEVETAAEQALQASTRVIDVRQYGAIGTSDDSATIQAALSDASSTGATVTMPTGTYQLTQPLDLGNAVLDLNGSELDFSGASLPNFTELVVARGSVSSLPNMTGPIEKYSNEITFASAHGLAAGDWVIAYNPNDFSFANIRSYYRDGQFFQVADVPSTTKIVTRGRAATFLTTGCVMSKLNPASGTVRNGVIRGKKGTPYQAVVLDYTAGSEASDMTMIDTERAMAVVRRSVDFRVSNIQGNNRIPESVGDFYGVMIGNCQSGYVEGCRVVSRRSAFSLGGFGTENSIPNRFIRVRDNQFTTVGTLAGMGFHGNAEYIVYEGNEVEGAMLFGGDHVTLRNNNIYSYRGPAITAGSELVGYDHTIDGNNIYVRHAWTQITDAPIVVDAGAVGLQMQSPTVGSVTRSGGTLRLTNNNVNIEAQGITANMAAVLIRKLETCTASAMCLDISNNVFTVGLIAGDIAYAMYAMVIRGSDNVGWYNIEIKNNDLQNLPIFLWGAHAKTTAINGNSIIDSKGYGVRVVATPAPYFSDSLIEIMDNRILNAGGTGIHATSHSGETIIISRNTIHNPNRWSNTSQNGSAIYLTNVGTVILQENIMGDVATPTRMTRYLTMSNVTKLIEKDNIRIGAAVGEDSLTGIGARLFDGDVSGDPNGVVIGSPGSIARSDNGNVYRKSSGTGTSGWTTM